MRATHGAIDRGPRTVPSIAGHARSHRSRVIVIIISSSSSIRQVVVIIRCTRRHRSRATHGAIDRGPRTVPSIAGHARCHRSRAQHGAIDRGPRTVPSRSINIAESHTATFYDSNRTSGRVKHWPARYETRAGTPMSIRFWGIQRAQRRLQLSCLGNANVPNEQYNIIQSSVSRRREHVFLE